MKIDWRTVGRVPGEQLSRRRRGDATARCSSIPARSRSSSFEMVRASGATLDAIWLTHAHIDHIGAIAGVKRVWDVPIYLHPADLAAVRSRCDAGGRVRPSVRTAARAGPRARRGRRAVALARSPSTCCTCPVTHPGTSCS